MGIGASNHNDSRERDSCGGKQKQKKYRSTSLPKYSPVSTTEEKQTSKQLFPGKEVSYFNK